jgi:hypothetical protein
MYNSVSIPHLRSRNNVGRGVVPLVESDAGVGSLVGTRELDRRAEFSGAGALNL